MAKQDYNDAARNFNEWQEEMIRTGKMKAKSSTPDTQVAPSVAKKSFLDKMKDIDIVGTLQELAAPTMKRKQKEYQEAFDRRNMPKDE